MYDELVKRLRAAAIMSEALSIFLPHSEGSAVAKLYNEAADVIEKLQKRVPPVPHGDLIDRDALWVEINKVCDRRDAGIITDLACLQQTLSAVRHAPTIIPAEEGET